jgi:DNA-binding IscR family transcriptional regulator
MRIGSQYTVGIHTLLVVAFFNEDKITSEIMAISIGCNPVIVRNVFTKLSRAGLLKPGMGKARTELGRPAEEITLYDVFAAVDADDTDEIFRMYPVNTRCPVGGEMHDLLSSRFDSAVGAMMDQLSKTTIADLVSELPQEKRRLPEALRE